MQINRLHVDFACQCSNEDRAGSFCTLVGHSWTRLFSHVGFQLYVVLRLSRNTLVVSQNAH